MLTIFDPDKKYIFSFEAYKSNGGLFCDVEGWWGEVDGKEVKVNGETIASIGYIQVIPKWCIEKPVKIKIGDTVQVNGQRMFSNEIGIVVTIQKRGSLPILVDFGMESGGRGHLGLNHELAFNTGWYFEETQLTVVQNKTSDFRKHLERQLKDPSFASDNKFEYCNDDVSTTIHGVSYRVMSNVTILSYYNVEGDSDMVSVNCSEGDTFDYELAKEICFQKAIVQEAKKKLKKLAKY